MTSFNYGGKEARDVGLTRRCHLSNIMRDGTFNDSTGWGITYLLFFFLKVITIVFLSKKIDGFSCLIVITLMALEKHFRGFESCDFIERLLFSCMSCCFKPEILRDLSIQPT